jgi:hypothetical protein
VVSVGLQASAQAADVMYSCDVPLITHLSRANYPSNFAGTVTIRGSGFGIYGSSPLVRVGSTLAIRNVWTSHSSLMFTPNFGTATRLPGVNVLFSALERNSAQNNISLVLYDRSRVESVYLDTPYSTLFSIHVDTVLIPAFPESEIFIRLLGKNFGMEINEVSVFVGRTQFPVSEINDGSISAFVLNGVGKNLIISLNVSGDISVVASDSPTMPHQICASAKLITRFAPQLAAAVSPSRGKTLVMQRIQI